MALGSAPSSAGSKQKAHKHFKVGRSLMKAEDFDAAVVEFEESVRLHPTKGGLFNLANCYKALHRYAEVLATLELLEGEFGSQLDVEMRTAVDQIKAEVTAIVVSLTVNVNRDGARILVDGDQAGISPLAQPLIIGPGVHEVSVELQGHRSQMTKIKVLAGDREMLNFVLVSESVPATEVAEPHDSPAESGAAVVEPAEAEAPRSPRSTGSKAGIAIAFTIGGLAAIGAGVTGGLALNAGKDVKAACDGKSCPPDQQDNIDRVTTLNATTDVLIGVAAAAVVAGIIVLAVSGSDEAPAEDAVAVRPLLLDNGGGASVGGRF